MKKTLSEAGIRSILNFRDAGGLTNSRGGKMRKGLIYRSANPDKISKEDLERLKLLGIKMIVDLRGPSEFSAGRAETPGIKRISLPLDFESATRKKLIPLITRHFNPEEINKVISDLYVELVEASKQVLPEVAGLILNAGNTPILIHCQAGKDRTGVLSALLQMIAGAGRDEIIKDYLASNDYLIPHFKQKLRIRKIFTLGFFPSDAVIHTVKQKHEDIQIVFDMVENHYGGINGYLSESGFDMSQLDKLKDVLTER
jgi:protein-tyrosine phosphatase